MHGAVHLLGTAKAFGSVDVTLLHAPISDAPGALWFATAVLLALWREPHAPRPW
jgi:hypothetical protein